MAVGDTEETPEQESAPTGRGAGPQGGGKGKRGRPRRTVVATGVDMTLPDDGGSSRPTAARRRGRSAGGADGDGNGSGSGDGNGNGSGNGGNGRGTRDRALRRVLAGLRSLDAGDFAVRMDSADDALLAEVSDIFNSVATKQARLADELSRVALSVGREGKMRDRATIGPAAGHWAASVDALNSLITDLVQPT